MMGSLPNIATGGGGLDMGGGGPSSNDSTVNNDNSFAGGVINMGSSFGVPTWALIAGGAVVVYIMFGRGKKGKK